MEALHTEIYKNLKINIYQDEDPISPQDEGDSQVFLVHYHRDCWIENPLMTEDNLRDWYQGEKIEQTKNYHIFPVAAYIHSGVHLSLESGFPGDSQGWDTSHVGAILVAKSEARLTKTARNIAKGLLEGWNSYLSGEVFGYEVLDGDTSLDSCWGYVGEMDYCITEARSIADYYAKQRQQAKEAKTKAYIKHAVPLDKR